MGCCPWALTESDKTEVTLAAATWLSNVPLCVHIYILIYIYTYLSHIFIHSYVNRHLGCFHVLVIVIVLLQILGYIYLILCKGLYMHDFLKKKCDLFSFLFLYYMVSLLLFPQVSTSNLLLWTELCSLPLKFIVEHLNPSTSECDCV